MTNQTKTQRRLIMIITGALCIAMSYGLSYIKLFSMPMGGSVTAASMLPLSLFSYLFGPWWGMLSGAVYGILQLLQKPEVVHWSQLLLEYPIAFGAIGLSGFFRKTHLALGTLVGGVGRFFCHFLAGATFFAEYAGTQNPWIYSLLYNGGYLGVDLLICVAVAFLIPVKRISSQLKLS